MTQNPTAVAFEATFLAAEEAEDASSGHFLDCQSCKSPDEGGRCDVGAALREAANRAGESHRAATEATRAAYAARKVRP